MKYFQSLYSGKCFIIKMVSGSVLNKYVFDDSTTVVQFPVFSNGLKFPYHEMHL